MNKDVVLNWISALRSGNYQQCKDKLHKKETDESHSYCCLGVLTELYRKTFPEKIKMIEVIKYGQCFYDYEINNKTEWNYLLEEVRDWAGITVPLERNLASMNDHGETFDDIARDLEAKL